MCRMPAAIRRVPVRGDVETRVVVVLNVRKVRKGGRVIDEVGPVVAVGKEGFEPEGPIKPREGVVAEDRPGGVVSWGWNEFQTKAKKGTKVGRGLESGSKVVKCHVSRPVEIVVDGHGRKVKGSVVANSFGRVGNEAECSAKPSINRA